MKYYVLFLLLVSCFSPLTSQSALVVSNLLNGDFESWNGSSADHWDVPISDRATYSSTIKHGGSYSLQTAMEVESWMMITQIVTGITEGTALLVEGYVYDYENHETISFAIIWLTNTNISIDYVLIDSSDTISSWQYLSGVAVAPATTANAKIIITVIGGPLGGLNKYVYVDDMAVSETTIVEMPVKVVFLATMVITSIFGVKVYSRKK